MRVLVCGGRNFNDLGMVWGQLDAFHALAGPITLLIHGAAPGADTLGAKWALSNNVEIAVYPAEWKRLGKSAGPIRNQRMIDEGRPDRVIAFPGGAGTADMVRRAKSSNVPVIEISTKDIEP